MDAARTEFLSMWPRTYDGRPLSGRGRMKIENHTQYPVSNRIQKVHYNVRDVKVNMRRFSEGRSTEVVPQHARHNHRHAGDRGTLFWYSVFDF